jgi:hypothetical protein
MASDPTDAMIVQKRKLEPSVASLTERGERSGGTVCPFVAVSVGRTGWSFGSGNGAGSISVCVGTVAGSSGNSDQSRPRSPSGRPAIAGDPPTTKAAMTVDRARARAGITGSLRASRRA